MTDIQVFRRRMLVYLVLAALYAVLHMQFVRLSVTYGAGDRAEVARKGVFDLPRDVLHGAARGPWQNRPVVYGVLGLAGEMGIDARVTNTAFKTFWLFMLLLALDWYMGFWFPQGSVRLAAGLVVTLLFIYAIPWFLYNADDPPFLCWLTLAFGAMFRGRVLLLVVSGLLATATKETAASLGLAYLLYERPWKQPNLRVVARIAAVGAACALPAVLSFALIHPVQSEFGVHFPFNVRGWRWINNLPLALLAWGAVRGVADSRFKDNLFRVWPWFGLYALQVLAFGMLVEVRIWYPLVLLLLPAGMATLAGTGRDRLLGCGDAGGRI